MKEQILEKLNEFKVKKNITILYAVDTGSRARGYNNKNSDYDIRFIYKYNDISDYLVLNKFNDVIQEEDGLFDFVGWDIKKALYLHFKSNPNLREWLISPICYVPDEIGIFRNLPDFNPEILKYHYYGQAVKINKLVQSSNEMNLKTLKKTLHAVRCNLSWMELNKGILPPTDLFKLIEGSDVDNDLKNIMLKLRKAYINMDIDSIDDDEFEIIFSWVDASFENFDKKAVKNPKRDIGDYNKRFHEILGLK